MGVLYSTIETALIAKRQSGRSIKYKVRGSYPGQGCQLDMPLKVGSGHKKLEKL